MVSHRFGGHFYLTPGVYMPKVRTQKMQAVRDETSRRWREAYERRMKKDEKRVDEPAYIQSLLVPRGPPQKPK